MNEHRAEAGTNESREFRWSAVLLILGIVAAFPGLALASGDESATAANGATPGKWRFSVTPIAVWGFNEEGPVILDGNARTVNASFSDIENHIDSAGGISFEVGKGSWAAFFGGSYLELLQEDASGPGPSGIKADVTLELTTIEVGFAYRLPVQPAPKAPNVEFLAGARYTKLEGNLDATSGATFNVEEDISWSDPILGMRVTQPLHKGLFAAARTDFGGFGLSSNQTQMQWNFVGGVGYMWRFEGWGIAAYGGYKIWHLDWEHPEDPTQFALDQRMQGPLGSLSFLF